jgi:signal transduction histidine kinase
VNPANDRSAAWSWLGPAAGSTPWRSLQVRLLGVLVLTVVIALATVALVARASTTTEFERYVQANQLQMQDVANQIAASTGDRLVVTSAQGRVILDSSGELAGRMVTPDVVAQLEPLPVPAPGADVLFVRRTASSQDTVTWTRALPPLASQDVLPLVTFDAGVADNREQVFVSAVTRSLLVGVLVGGGVAVALALAFARGILRPIGALTAAARQMELGDLSQRVEVRSDDEIGQLGHAFNGMAEGLARTELLRRTMVTDVAHELRTPLTNLRGYLEAVRDGVTPARPAVIESLYEEAMLLSHLVDDLQDLSLSEGGRLVLHCEPVEVHTLLTSAAQSLGPRACEQGLSVRVEVAPMLPMAWADPQRIGQVLRNLLANAATHTAWGGRIVLRALVSGEQLRIEVHDSGSGIAAEHLPNVFERFYRADPSRTRATGGAGIGLAIVKQLVEAHGGTVGVASTLSEGSCFSFTLPVSVGDQEALPPLITLGASGAGARPGCEGVGGVA